MRKKIVNGLKVGFKFGLSFAILFYMIKTGRLDLAVVGRVFSDLSVLGSCIFLVFTATLVSLYRWSLLLRGQGLIYPFTDVIRYGMIGAFFNTTMPGAVSGDLIKAWYVISDSKGKKTPVFASILLDRVMGVFGLVLVSASSLAFAESTIWDRPQIAQLSIIVILLALAVLAFLLLTFFAEGGPLGMIRRRIDLFEKYSIGRVFLQAFDSWLLYGKSPWLLVKATSLSMITHCFVVVVSILAAKALGDNSMSLSQFLLLAPLGLLATAIPIAPAGLGVGHAAFGALFGLAGSKSGAEIFTLLVTIQIFINLFGVFFYLRSKKMPSHMEE